MTQRVTIAKAARARAGVAVLAGAMALASALPAMAQSSASNTAQDRQGYYYDACKRDQTQRGTVGAVLGGGAGAVIGSNVAARNARTEGALLGGLLGAIAGGVVGNKSAACTSASQYSSEYAPRPAPAASNTYYERDAYAARAEREAKTDPWVEERRPLATDRGDVDGCTLAESPIYMPDGRTQTRFVRVCRDASGKYAVVD